MNFLGRTSQKNHPASPAELDLELEDLNEILGHVVTIQSEPDKAMEDNEGSMEEGDQGEFSVKIEEDIPDDKALVLEQISAKMMEMMTERRQM